MIRSVILLSVLFLASCTKSVDVQLDTKTDVLFSEDNDKTLQLTMQDPAYAELASWLEENRDSWYSTSGKYPGGIYFKSGDFGIQITKTKVVLYSSGPRGSKAEYVQNIGMGDLKALKKLAEQ